MSINVWINVLKSVLESFVHWNTFRLSDTRNWHSRQREKGMNGSSMTTLMLWSELRNLWDPIEEIKWNHERKNNNTKKLLYWNKNLDYLRVSFVDWINYNSRTSVECSVQIKLLSLSHENLFMRGFVIQLWQKVEANENILLSLTRKNEQSIDLHEVKEKVEKFWSKQICEDNFFSCKKKKFFIEYKLRRVS